jgi:hypothetical protein
VEWAGSSRFAGDDDGFVAAGKPSVLLDLPMLKKG